MARVCKIQRTLHVNEKSLKIPNGVIRSHKSKKDRLHKKKDKRTNNDLQSIAQKTKDRATRTPLKTWGELRCCKKVSSSCSTCDTRCVTLAPSY